MSFRYFNPGFVDLLENKALAVQNESYDYSRIGVSYSQTSSNGFLITKQINTEDLYVSFDLYNYVTDTGHFYFSNTSNLSGLEIKSYIIHLCYLSNSIGNGLDLKQNAINHVYAHFHLDGSKETSFMELKVNNAYERVNLSSLSYEYYGFKNSAAPIKLYHNNSKVKFSEIILSDEYIDPKEQVIKLPINSTQSDMAFDSETGIYTATATNQSLLSAVNVNSLVEEYGANSPVTGIIQVGNPAYKTAEGLSSLTAFAKNNSGTVTNYGTYSLADNTDAVIADSRKIENMTIADLENIQFGWKAGG